MTRSNPLRPFNDLIDEEIAVEKAFFHMPDGTYDKIGLRQALIHQYTAHPPVLMGVSLSHVLLAQHLETRVDRYFREDRVRSGPFIGRRKVIQIPIPGMDTFEAKVYVECTYRDIERYDEYIVQQRDSYDYIHQHNQAVLTRMAAAGATQADPILPYLTDEERQAFS